jgi:hypothetical protein
MPQDGGIVMADTDPPRRRISQRTKSLRWPTDCDACGAARHVLRNGWQALVELAEQADGF